MLFFEQNVDFSSKMFIFSSKMLIFEQHVDFSDKHIDFRSKYLFFMNYIHFMLFLYLSCENTWAQGTPWAHGPGPLGPRAHGPKGSPVPKYFHKKGIEIA